MFAVAIKENGKIIGTFPLDKSEFKQEKGKEKEESKAEWYFGTKLITDKDGKTYSVQVYLVEIRR